MEAILALSNGEEFGEVKDIIARYDTLSATNQELIERAHDAQDKTEEERLAFTKAIEVDTFINTFIYLCNYIKRCLGKKQYYSKLQQ